jgi:hypothetical protein
LLVDDEGAVTIGREVSVIATALFSMSFSYNAVAARARRVFPFGRAGPPFPFFFQSFGLPPVGDSGANRSASTWFRDMIINSVTS